MQLGKWITESFSAWLNTAFYSTRTVHNRESFYDLFLVWKLWFTRATGFQHLFNISHNFLMNKFVCVCVCWETLYYKYNGKKRVKIWFSLYQVFGYDILVIERAFFFANFHELQILAVLSIVLSCYRAMRNKTWLFLIFECFLDNTIVALWLRFLPIVQTVIKIHDLTS